MIRELRGGEEAERVSDYLLTQSLDSKKGLFTLIIVLQTNCDGHDRHEEQVNLPQEFALLLRIGLLFHGIVDEIMGDILI